MFRISTDGVNHGNILDAFLGKNVSDQLVEEVLSKMHQQSPNELYEAATDAVKKAVNNPENKNFYHSLAYNLYEEAWKTHKHIPSGIELGLFFLKRRDGTSAFAIYNDLADIYSSEFHAEFKKFILCLFQNTPPFEVKSLADKELEQIKNERIEQTKRVSMQNLILQSKKA